MKFRFDINGLRAIAVIIVVLFHFDEHLLPGGFIGVDVFFVISGFLMTSIIIAGIDRGSFQVMSFYIARARRIVPPLVILCLTLLVLGWFFLLPTDYQALGKHVVASLFFVSNIVYWTESGYFAMDSHEKWLLHTWSLSAEWQFYLLYPIALIVAKRYLSHVQLRWFCVTLVILGFAAATLAASRSPDAAFYLLPTRAWEMLLGGAAYFFPSPSGRHTRKYLELLGLLAIAAGTALITGSNTWPGPFTLLPAGGAFLVIMACRNDSTVLSARAVQWAGRISYSVYLWHWPVVVLLSYAGVLGRTVFTVTGVAASFALGELSYRYVEQRYGKVSNTAMRRLGQGTFAVAALFGVAVFLSYGAVTGLRPLSTSDKAAFLDRYKGMHEVIADDYFVKCDAYTSSVTKGTTDIDPSCTQSTGDGGVFLWGDSHAQALSFGLRASLKDVPFYQVATSGCRPNLQPDRVQKGLAKAACDHANSYAIAEVRRLKPAVVVLAQEAAHESTDWEAIAATLLESGTRQVILVGPVPQWRPSLPSAFVRRHWGDTSERIEDASLDRRVMRTNEILGARKAKNYDYVSPINWLCTDQACKMRFADTGELFAFDYGHLTRQASRLVATEIIVPVIKVH